MGGRGREEGALVVTTLECSVGGGETFLSGMVLIEIAGGWAGGGRTHAVLFVDCTRAYSKGMMGSKTIPPVRVREFCYRFNQKGRKYRPLR